MTIDQVGQYCGPSSAVSCGLGALRLVHESLMKLDFMVRADLFMTPTAELADIVLPAARPDKTPGKWNSPQLHKVASRETAIFLS